MKKVNAILAWIATLVLLGHLATMTYSMLTGWYDFVICKTFAYATAITVGSHVLLSLIIMFFMHDGTALGSYGKLNKRTIAQRASGLVILLLLHAHVKSFGFIVASEALDPLTKVGIVVTELLFFGALCVHLSTSFSRSLITVGLLRNESSEKLVDKAAAIVFSATFILASFALVRFVVSWMAF